jgi:IS30 family transposase
MKITHLTYEQRYAIECMLKTKRPRKEIILAIGISESTLSREISRNSKARSYNAKYAQMLADERQKEQHVKTKLTQDMLSYIISKIKLYWSPDQIMGTAREEGVPMLSYVTIYKLIRKDKQQGGELYKYLRNSGKKYKKRYGSSDKRGQIPDKVPIEERPKEVDLKQRIGDFEIDLIIGKNHKGAQLTIVDRATSFTLIQTLKTKRASEVSKAIIAALMPYKAIVKTITNDNGKEFANHKEVAKKLEADVYFCNPYASYERGLNEYTNKLIRQFYPKNMELNNIKQKQNLKIMKLLNQRPRKILGYKTPETLFFTKFEKLALAG